MVLMRFCEGERQADFPHPSCAWAALLLAHQCSLCSLPDDCRCGKALGPVESLQGHLRDPTKILIGYSRGLLVIWNQAAQCADCIFLGNQVCVGGWSPQPRPSAPGCLAHACLPWPTAAGEPVLGAQWQHAGQLAQRWQLCHLVRRHWQLPSDATYGSHRALW